MTRAMMFFVIENEVKTMNEDLKSMSVKDFADFVG